MTTDGYLPCEELPVSSIVQKCLQNSIRRSFFQDFQYLLSWFNFVLYNGFSDFFIKKMKK